MIPEDVNMRQLQQKRLGLSTHCSIGKNRQVSGRWAEFYEKTVLQVW
jgi:hypothetical protein